MRIIIQLLLFSCSVLFTSCLVTYGDTVTRSYTRLSNDTGSVYATPKPIALLFAGEFVPFDYRQVGLISVQGNQYSTNEDLLDHLKYEAHRNGANAIINISYGYLDRQTGQIFSKCPPYHYMASVCSGMAVKMWDANWLAAHVNNDTSYAQHAKAADEAAARRTSGQLVGSIVLPIVLLGLSLAVAASR